MGRPFFQPRPRRYNQHWIVRCPTTSRRSQLGSRLLHLELMHGRVQFGVQKSSAKYCRKPEGLRGLTIVSDRTSSVFVSLLFGINLT